MIRAARLWLQTLATIAVFGAFPAIAQTAGAPVAPVVQSYSDIADLVGAAPLIVAATVRKVAMLPPAQANDLRPGWGRIYVEADVAGLVKGSFLPSDSLRYLADVPLDARGKLPALKKKVVLLFLKGASPGGDAQLVVRDGQWVSDDTLRARVAAVVADMAAPGAPGVITGVYQIYYEPGTLAGDGETQVFLKSATGDAASISVLHRPGQALRWSASFSEVANAQGRPPARDTLAWYRLACFLPAQLPEGANVSQGAANKAQADADYARVIADLGACGRTRTAP